MKSSLLVVALPQELDHAPIPHDLPVVYTGVGKLNAALALTAAIAQHRPSQIINFGTVGRVVRNINGLVEIANVIQRDMDAQPLCERGITPYDDSPVMLDSGFTGVRCATGDSFVRDVDPWLLEQSVDVVDMELFALALICHRQGIGWRSFKYITDDTDGDAGQDWLERAHHGRDLFLDRLHQIL